MDGKEKQNSSTEKKVLRDEARKKVLAGSLAPSRGNPGASLLPYRVKYAKSESRTWRAAVKSALFF